mgnify:CR=1 FL=1
MKNGERGFTLIEVLVALAIAAGGLILLLSGNNASLRSSVAAATSERMSRFLNQKADALALGIDTAASGTIPDFPSWHWRAIEENPELDDLPVKRISVRAQSNAGHEIQCSVLIYRRIKDRK